jgi:hypothetical protein
MYNMYESTRVRNVRKVENETESKNHRTDKERKGLMMLSMYEMYEK